MSIVHTKPPTHMCRQFMLSLIACTGDWQSLIESPHTLCNNRSLCCYCNPVHIGLIGAFNCLHCLLSTPTVPWSDALRWRGDSPSLPHQLSTSPLDYSHLTSIWHCVAIMCCQWLNCALFPVVCVCGWQYGQECGTERWVISFRSTLSRMASLSSVATAATAFTGKLLYHTFISCWLMNTFIRQQGRKTDRDRYIQWKLQANAKHSVNMSCFFQRCLISTCFYDCYTCSCYCRVTEFWTEWITVICYMFVLTGLLSHFLCWLLLCHCHRQVSWA